MKIFINFAKVRTFWNQKLGGSEGKFKEIAKAGEVRNFKIGSLWKNES